jgi:hypothetical protein
MGYLSYALDEPLISKVFRWLFISAGFVVTVAFTPLLSAHECLCTGGNGTLFGEFFIPIVCLVFMVGAVRFSKARRPGTPKPQPTESSGRDKEKNAPSDS